MKYIQSLHCQLLKRSAFVVVLASVRGLTPAFPLPSFDLELRIERSDVLYPAVFINLILIIKQAGRSIRSTQGIDASCGLCRLCWQRDLVLPACQRRTVELHPTLRDLEDRHTMGQRALFKDRVRGMIAGSSELNINLSNLLADIYTGNLIHDSSSWRAVIG